LSKKKGVTHFYISLGVHFRVGINMSENLPSRESSTNSDAPNKLPNKSSLLPMNVVETEKKELDSFVHMEGGLGGWMVVIASGYCYGILIGMMSNYALIYNGLEKEYNTTENHVLYTGKCLMHSLEKLTF
jgi:hypothetical protein